MKILFYLIIISNVNKFINTRQENTVLYVDADGYARTPILAPRLKTSDLKDLAVMVHANTDNYSDTPALGGGGERIACGGIK